MCLLREKVARINFAIIIFLRRVARCHSRGTQWDYRQELYGISKTASDSTLLTIVSNWEGGYYLGLN
jgi:hypothetical protein